MSTKNRDYQIMDINIKAGIAFTIASAVIVLIVFLLNKQV